MHAVVITVGIEPGKADEATAILHNQVVPDVKATPGFVSGTWARTAADRGQLAAGLRVSCLERLHSAGLSSPKGG